MLAALAWPQTTGGLQHPCPACRRPPGGRSGGKVEGRGDRGCPYCLGKGHGQTWAGGHQSVHVPSQLQARRPKREHCPSTGKAKRTCSEWLVSNEAVLTLSTLTSTATSNPVIACHWRDLPPAHPALKQSRRRHRHQHPHRHHDHRYSVP